MNFSAGDIPLPEKKPQGDKHVAVHGGYKLYFMERKRAEEMSESDIGSLDEDKNGEEGGDEATGNRKDSSIIVLVVSPDGITYVIDLDELKKNRKKGKGASLSPGDDDDESPENLLAYVKAKVHGKDEEVTLMIDPAKLKAGLENPMSPPDALKSLIDPQEQLQVMQRQLERQPDPNRKSPGQELMEIVCGNHKDGRNVFKSTFTGFDQEPEVDEQQRQPGVRRGTMNYSLVAVGTAPEGAAGFESLLSDSVKMTLGGIAKGLGNVSMANVDANSIGHSNIIGDGATAKAKEAERNQAFGQGTGLPGQN